MVQRVSRYGYLITVSLFVVGVLTQVYLVGLSLLGGQPSWLAHITLGHGLGILAILMVILVYLGRHPRSMKPLTWTNLIVYLLLADVVVFLRGKVGVIAALHPVLAVILFATAATLTVRAWSTVRMPENIPPVEQLQESQV